jgi:hypothetical protein
VVILARISNCQLSAISENIFNEFNLICIDGSVNVIFRNEKNLRKVIIDSGEIFGYTGVNITTRPGESCSVLSKKETPPTIRVVVDYTGENRDKDGEHHMDAEVPSSFLFCVSGRIDFCNEILVDGSVVHCTVKDRRVSRTLCRGYIS